MNELDIHIEVFEGPLDLLMHLIRKNNLDIYDIPISQITKEYLSYLEVMKTLNLEVAGEFLVMATTLMQIKAKMLLPAREMPGEEGAGPDPRGALASMLEEYQRYKEAGDRLFEYNMRQGKERGQAIMRVCTATQWVVAGIGVAIFILGFVIGLFK